MLLSVSHTAVTATCEDQIMQIAGAQDAAQLDF